MSSTLDLQQQDLAIYKDNSIVSHKLLSPSFNTFNLILYTQSNKPTWLNTTLIENCLFDTAYINTTQSHRSYTLQNPKSFVLFASFVNDSKFYSKNFKKFLNFEIDDDVRIHSFKFISFLHNFEKWFDTLMLQVNKMTNLSNGKKINIFLENPEFILYLTPENNYDLLLKLQQLNSMANLFIISSFDKQLLEYGELANDLATIHSNFLLRLIHKSNLIIQLKPLSTGRADDVTGEVKINRGCLECNNGDLEVNEREYLYLVNKEGNIKLFYR